MCCRGIDVNLHQIEMSAFGLTLRYQFALILLGTKLGEFQDI